jgi:myosin heavy subunit
MSASENITDDDSKDHSKDQLERERLKQMYNGLAQEYNTLLKALIDFKNNVQREVICSVQNHNRVQNMQVVNSMCTLVEKMYEESDSDDDDDIGVNRLQELATATVQLEEKQKELTTMSTKLESVHQNYQNMWKNVKELTEEKTRVREELGRLEEAVSVERAGHEMLQENISKLKDAKRRYKKDIEQQKLKIEQQQDTYSNLQEQINLQQRQKNDLEACVRNLQQKSVLEMKTLLQAKKDVALESVDNTTKPLADVEMTPLADEKLSLPLSTDAKICNAVFEIDFILTEVHAQLMKILSISDMDTVHNLDFLEDIAVSL